MNYGQKFAVETAPMAGYTTAEFRSVLINLGARTVWTEMVSVAAIFYGQRGSLEKTQKLLEIPTSDKKVKHIVQIFGKTPEHFRFAIKSGHLDGFDEININMGCPANKIVRNGEGVALMTKPELAREIIQTCVKASKVPVSVKMRLGKERGFDYVSFAKMCEDAGAVRLVVHGRYGEQGYSGTADWGAVSEIVGAVKIPVVANGDVKDIETAKQCLDITKASGVMVGRALLPIYRKYFDTNLRILRGEKICRDGNINPNSFDVCRLFGTQD